MLRYLGRVLLALLIVTGAGWAQVPEAPVDCDIALRIQPFPDSMTAEQRAHMADHPLFRLISKAGARAMGFDPLNDLHQALGGTVVAGVMPTADGGSALIEFFRDNDARQSHRSMISELDELIADLDSHKDTSGSYPTDYRKYIDEERYYDPYLPSGVEVEYEALQGGEQFRLTVSYEDGAAIRDFGPPPSYHSEDGHKNWSTEKPPAPLNFVVALELKDVSKAKELLGQIMGQPKAGFWSSDVEGVRLFATTRGNWLLVGDQRENMGPFLAAVEGREKGISYNPAYRTVARNIQMDAPFTIFINAPRMADSVLNLTDELDPRLVRMIGPMGYSVQSYGESQTRLEAFVGVNPPEDTKLAEFFASTAGKDPELVLNLSNVPWDAANVLALDLTAFKELLDASVDLYPDLNEGYEMGQDVFAGMLGIDAEAGFNKLAEGPVIASFERIDIFLTSIDTYMLGRGDDDDDDESPADSALRFFPATVAAKIPSAQNRKALRRLLSGPKDEPTAKKLVYGVEVEQRPEIGLSYAEDGDWLYVSGSNTDRLMRNMLASAKGRKETLSSLQTWTDFQLRLHGRFLAFGHQKVDAVYSIVKGFLLFMGADFRPLAVELGQLRDYHSVMTAVPEGFVMVGEIVKGDGR